MSPTKKQPASPPRVDEQSSIRESRAPSGLSSSADDGGPQGHASSPRLRAPSRRVSSPDIVTPRDLRIEGKVARAEKLLAVLPEGDPRLRLLEVALLRRDETLIDGILRTLESP